MNQDDALKLYDFVFKKLYTHLDVDTVTNTYYKSFNKLIIENYFLNLYIYIYIYIYI